MSETTELVRLKILEVKHIYFKLMKASGINREFSLNRVITPTSPESSPIKPLITQPFNFMILRPEKPELFSVLIL